ncbi:hypothetical protein [Iamia sp. SCSIO 61187]|nr:hypothetical protein [Iamia sp. SCSIO 61187]
MRRPPPRAATGTARRRREAVLWLAVLALLGVTALLWAVRLGSM